MSKSHFQAYSGETLTSMVYYSFILKQSRKRIPALLTQHMTAKTRWCLFYSLNIQNMISFRPLPRWIFFSVKLIRIIMDHGPTFVCFFLKAFIFLLLYQILNINKTSQRERQDVYTWIVKGEAGSWAGTQRGLWIIPFEVLGFCCEGSGSEADKLGNKRRMYWRLI